MTPLKIFPFRTGIPSLLTLLAMACAPSAIHPGFESNEQVRGLRQHFLNPDLKVYHTTLGDIRYVGQRDTLLERLSGLQLNKVLAYARSEVPPYYEYYLLAAPRRGRLDLAPFDRVHDTLVGGRRWVFLGRGLDGDPFPESDFSEITGSLQAGRSDYRAQIDPLTVVADRFRNTARFLEAYAGIAEYSAKDALERDYQQQMELTYLSMLGDNPWYRDLLGEREGRYPRYPEVLQALREKGQAGKQQVLEALLSHTEGRQVVMFNENHFMPWHRVLLTALLPGLREQGFRYLALEALENDSLLNAGNPPDLRTGFYTREQHFYRLLRTAQRLGFEVVAYEPSGGDRELLQAQNLYGRTLGKDPGARVVVLAGLAHIYENGGDSRIRMAQHFKALSGTDPLTVSQTDLAHYRNEVGSDLVLIPSDSLERPRWKQVDLHVVNNLGWQYPPGDFRYTNTGARPLQLALYNTAGWASAYGYLGDIPGFSALLLPGESFSAALPEGAYHLVLFGRDGKVLHSEPVLRGTGR